MERMLTDPMDRLFRVLESGEEQLEARRAELAEVRYALFQLSAGGAARHARTSGVEPLAAEMAAPMLRYLLLNTTGLCRVSTMSVHVTADLAQENRRLNQDLLAAGQFRQRTLYPMDIVDSEDGRAWLKAFAGVGEEQGLSLAPPSEFTIFGQHSLVAVAEWGNVGSDYVMVRDPMLIAAFTALFDRAFERALPVVPEDARDDEDLRLVKLLGLGLKDESIARYLGCSLRTVRRRVAALMARHGVQTRFQLGLAAASGELGSPREPADR
ncbi:DNA-binding CsgD family transcriptional regulator [Phycicoccus badiiscoriae]|uniref:DNA-binding CsgD family transcriptional regulator n=1 Tax=Pedococcus badiiscoriae TaxID=642776 RepID=A0A852WK47_9MICO|nr:hypothetical protein [Pedococcus badiiscoriae]NYG07054.1 DNA-binding CsgD family transcriptional regulator [Pedococcus badiiscoriae]